jgi:CheY-like chemotaxis protein
MKILFIEDNADFTVPATDVFESLGYSVEVVDSADDFAALTKEHIAQFGIVVIDAMLRLGKVLKSEEAPETGIAIFRRLRRMFPRMPVLFLTALQRTDIATMVTLDEITAYHGKPIPKDFSALTSIMTNLAKASKA